MHCYRTLSYTDALSRTTSYTYDTAGRLTSETAPADANGVQRVKYLSYGGSFTAPTLVRLCGLTTTCGTNAEVKTQYSYLGATALPRRCQGNVAPSRCRRYWAPMRKSRAKPPSPFLRFNSSPEVIRLVVLMYVRFPLSLRNVEDLLFERGIDLCHETIRFWWNRFGPMFAGEVRRQRVSHMRGFRHWRWHLDEVYVKIGGEMHYLWRAVDHEGEVLESYVTKTRDKAAALRFMKKALRRHGAPQAITTDGLGSYKAAMKTLGNAEKQEIGRWANNRVENSHLPFRRRERAMLRFRRMKTLQKFASVHANVHNHFNLERHLVDRTTYKERRSAALADWRVLAG